MACVPYIWIAEVLRSLALAIEMQKNSSYQRIAKVRIAALFVQAEEKHLKDPGLSRRYVALARKIAMKYNLRFSKEQKMIFCKRCSTYLKQGHNATVRLAHGKRVLKCMECGYVRRFVYK